MRSSVWSKGTFRRSACALALAVCAALAVAGCGGDDDGTRDTAGKGGATTGGTLTLVSSFAPTSLDPMKSSDDPQSIWFSQLAYEPLINVEAGGELAPGIAESWRYVGDGNRAFELKIKEGLTFADGLPVDAEAVAESIRYWMRNGVNAPAWGGSFEKVEATDPQTVRIDFSEPYPIAAQILTDMRLAGSVISPRGIAKPSALGNQTFGAGPYQLDTDATIANSTYVYVPNPEYADTSRQHWKKVVINVITDPNAALQAVRTGQADLMIGNASTISPAESAGLEITKAPMAVDGVALGDRGGEVAPELRDVRVRQALNYAIDRDAIVAALYEGAGEPAMQMSPSEGVDHVDALNERYPYDPDKARELLAEAGYADGFEMGLATPTAFALPDLMQAVANQWAEIGVDVKIATVQNAAQWMEDVQTKKYPTWALHYSHRPEYLRATSFYLPNPNLWNAFATRDAELVDLFDQASATPDPAEQAQIWQQAAERFVEQAWTVPVVTTESIFVSDPDRVTGIEVDRGSRLTPDVVDIQPAG